LIGKTAKNPGAFLKNIFEVRKIPAWSRSALLSACKAKPEKNKKRPGK
jgi:hypothetical protein